MRCRRRTGLYSTDKPLTRIVSFLRVCNNRYTAKVSVFCFVVKYFVVIMLNFPSANATTCTWHALYYDIYINLYSDFSYSYSKSRYRLEIKIYGVQNAQICIEREQYIVSNASGLAVRRFSDIKLKYSAWPDRL